jgi:tetratricopeptide (TPR) repeat protein
MIDNIPIPTIARRGIFDYVPAMSFFCKTIFNASAAAILFALTGCSPTDQSWSDEEKEPHFVLGQSRVNAMDYQGAIEAFEQSLDANPHSAAAHYQLAMLFDTREPDPAAAIYHYQQYLKLDPAAQNSDVILGRITACKQQLAEDVLQLPSASAMQGQFERLEEQNRQLQEEVDKWRAFYASQARTNPPPQYSSVPVANPSPVPPAQTFSVQTQTANANHSGNPVGQTPALRTHAVAAGETEVGIARKSGVKLSALQAANPGVNPNRLHVGQILNIPPP